MASNGTPPEPAVMPKLLITAGEAAELLSISARTLWQLTNDGQIPVMRVSKRAVRYCPEALRRWITEKQEAGRRATSVQPPPQPAPDNDGEVDLDRINDGLNQDANQAPEEASH